MGSSDLNSLREALKLSPDNIPLLGLYASSCIDQWNLKEGQETFEKILKLQPDNIDAQIGIAHILFKKGNIAESLIRLETLEEKNLLNAKGMLLLSKIVLTRNNVSQAKELYNKAIQIDQQLSNNEYEEELNKPSQGKEALNQDKNDELSNQIKVPANSIPDDNSDIDNILSSIEKSGNGKKRITFARGV